MDWNGKKALVTGGAGFVPSHVVDALLARGAEVTVIDNMQAGRRDNLAHVAGDVRILEDDIRDREALRRAMKGMDCVFHLAANASVPNSNRDPRYDFETNSAGSFNVYEAARDLDVDRVVYASSAAVYSPPQRVPMDETHPLAPVSFYGISKLNAERLGLMFHEMFGLGFTAIRIFNTYGPRQPRYVLADLVRKLMKDPERLEVLGTGEQIRDYAFATDTAGAFVAAAENPGMVGDVYNIAGGNPVSIKQLVGIILEVMGLTGAEVTYTGKSWKGDIAHLEADITKLKGMGYAPRVGLNDGIRTTIESGTIVGESEF